MLADFERRLADVLGARLPAPLRGLVDVAPGRDVARVVVSVRHVEPLEEHLCAVRPEIVPGAPSPRRVLRLRCDVGLEIPLLAAQTRGDQMQALDRVIYELGDAAWRSGASLLPGDGSDPGFLIQQLRVPLSDPPSSVMVRADGLFWPADAPGQAGVPIVEARLRASVQPLRLFPPEPRLIAGGGPVDLSIELGGAGTLRVESGGRVTLLPFGAVVVSVVDAGGRPGAGTLGGGVAGTAGARVAPSTAAAPSSSTRRPPGRRGITRGRPGRRCGRCGHRDRALPTRRARRLAPAMAIAFVEKKVGRGRGFAAPDDVAAPGLAHTVSWSGVAGATRADVLEASVEIAPSVAPESVQDAPVQKDGGWVVAVPAGRRVKSLTLHGLKVGGGSEITDSGSLLGMRLAVSFPPARGGGWDSPRFAVPPVDRVRMVPASLTGATFSNRVLALRDAVPASRVRVTLVSGAAPQDFAEQAAELARIHLGTEMAPRNIALLGPDDGVLWQMPELDPDAPATSVDLRASLEQAMNARLASKQPLEATFTVRADAPALAYVSFSTPAGALLRVRGGVLRTELAGDPVPLALGGPPADETPGSVVGDLTVKYAGIRILETVSDASPVAGAMVSGSVVGDASILRVFPPRAFEGVVPARVGVIGRAPEDCELSVEFVPVTGDVAGAALGPPAVLALAADGTIRTRWVDVPRGVALTGAVGIRVRANRGRFFWASGEAPLVRVAVRDPNPAGRPLFLGSARLKDIGAAESHEPGFAFPATVFRRAAPVLASNLFLTVDVSDLTMRYPR